MPETEGQDRSLSELVVKEAVQKGMDTPLRDSILEGVEEAGETQSSARRLPLTGALVGLGAAVGYLAGRESLDLEETPLEDVQEPEIIEDVVESDETGAVESMMEDEEETETSSSRRLPRLLAIVGIIAGAALLRRRLSGGEEEEWEPIEEFEPATTAGMDEDEEETEEEAGDEVEAGAEDEEE
ncbi:hypothetical protein [Halosolutus gelatinilyticus]|uniref:hypothetical protein n=1 Tax=Halosolutus gelatinilyticus TaxID=2931975 RepID=UPI001FF58818|nr:hypothetical protein [Halosolutus gelatinilyticus]